ncbi:MAG: DNA replication/repair protein RecF [Sporichthyaceae bacterium]
MHLETLALQDFRSYPTAELTLEPGPCLFLGRNGKGKTNLIEAIGYASTLGSHRVATDAPLVRAGAPRAIVRAGVVKDERRALVEIEINPGKANRVQLNRNPLRRPSQVLGVLSTVLFAPEDLALVKGDPSERRRFLDDLLVALTPRLAGVRSDYERALRQRNALLKTAGAALRSGRGDLSTLDSWDAQVAEFGGEMLAARVRLVALLAPWADEAYRGVSAADDVAGLEYRSSLGTDVELSDEVEHMQAELAKALVSSRQQELDRGISLVGPHRDDLVLSLGPLPARGYASHGESWSFALALRLASYELLRGEAGGSTDPVLILDDVFAELDAGRRSRLAELVAGAEQVLITAAVAEDVPPELLGARYAVADNAVARV